MKKKLFTFLPAVALLLLLLTNPSVKDFKDHLGKTSYQGLIREHNYFICSTYVDNSYLYSYSAPKKYFGIFGNFYIENQHSSSVSTDGLAKADSAKMDTTKITADTGKDPLHILSK